MKIKTVQPGQVYAYRDRKYGALRQAVLLSQPGEMYTTEHRSTKIVKSDADKPKPSPSRRNTGHLVAVGFDVSGASLEDALERGIAWRPDVPFQYHILTQTRFFIGPYDQVKAAEDEADRKLEEHQAALRDEEVRDHLVLDEVIAALHEEGVHAVRTGRHLTLRAAEAHKLLSLIARPVAS